MVGLSTTVGRPDPQLVVARGDPRLGLGRPRDSSQAHTAQDAVHNQGPHTPLVLLDRYDLSAAVAPDHSARDLPEKVSLI